MYSRMRRLAAWACAIAVCAGQINIGWAEEAAEDVLVVAEEERSAEQEEQEKAAQAEADAMVVATPVPEVQEDVSFEPESPEKETEALPEEPVVDSGDAEPTEAPDVEGTCAPETEADGDAPETMEPETEADGDAPETMEPEVVEKAPEAGAAPESTPYAEPSATPQPDVSPFPTEVSKLDVQVTADREYAVAGKDTVTMTVSVSGGAAPYRIALMASNAEIDADHLLAEESGEYQFYAKPIEFGRLKVKFEIADANGMVEERQVEVNAPVRECEKSAAWAKSVGHVELTGDWRSDLVAIAESQIGYRESKRNYIIDGEGQIKGYTRYGDWYGSSYADWCAMFVSFCLNYAEIPEASVPREANCAKWKKQLEYAGAYRDDEHEYEPRPGDLIFFNWDEKNVPVHVGIVEEVTETQIYTIEGNSASRVRRQAYDRHESEIVGYGNLTKLMLDAGIAPCAELPELPESGLVAYTAGANVNIRNKPTAESAGLIRIGDQGTEVLVHEALLDENGAIWYCVEYEGFIGYVRADLISL